MRDRLGFYGGRGINGSERFNPIFDDPPMIIRDVLRTGSALDFRHTLKYLCAITKNFKIPAVDPSSIAFDFDGVISDTIGCVIRVFNDLGYFGISSQDVFEYNVNRLDIQRVFGKSLPFRISDILKYVVDDIPVKSISPVRGAKSVLSAIVCNSKLTIVTSRENPDRVEEWLRCKFFNDREMRNVRVLAVGDNDSKISWTALEGLDWFLDDNFEFIEEWPCRVWARPLLFRQPWNCMNDRTIPTIESWKHLSRILKL